MPTNEPRNFDLNIEKILEGWEVKHAIREVIANALDEQVLSNTQDITISADRSGNWHIRDFGRGIRYENLTQNENPEKLKNAGKVIGKFGVGLKDALATLNRRSILVHIRSAHCDISLVEAAKYGFEDVITLQAAVSPASSPKMAGSDFELQGVSAADLKAAKDFFLRFSGERVLDNTVHGQILERIAGHDARVYVTGLLVAEEERFAFSYNITSLTTAMRRALNRERTNVGRTAYTDRVKSMLLSSQSEEVAQVLAVDLSNIERGTQHDEVGWTDVAVHACQILNARKKVVFVTASELGSARDSIDHATEDGYDVIAIPDNVRRSLAGLKDIQGNPVRDLSVYQAEWNNSFEFKFVSSENLTLAERRVFDCWQDIVNLVGGLPTQVKEVKISETMRPDFGTGRECQGLWEAEKKRIIIKRSELGTITSFAGTLLHEITHANSGCPDVTDVWEFRWRDRTSGKTVYRRIVLGTKQEIPTATDARKAAAGIVLEANSDDSRLKDPLTLLQLVEHYRHRELSPDNTWKTYSTKAGYENYLKRWIVPKWGEYAIACIKPIEVELWLRQLPLARASCAKIKNVMSVLFSHACRYDLFDDNPIRFVRQSGKRRRIPVILTVDEIRRLLSVLKPKYRVLVYTDASTGLRQSELFGLKWSDVDFENGQINVVRSVVHGVVSNCKTESSMKPIPMEPDLAKVLREWKSQSRYTAHGDWVFASARTVGKKPMWGENMIRKPIRRALRELGIHKAIGWHTFRHSFSSLLRSLGIDIKVQQDLLRHSSARLTLDTYTQAVTPAKREAQNAVLRLFTQN